MDTTQTLALNDDWLVSDSTALVDGVQVNYSNNLGYTSLSCGCHGWCTCRTVYHWWPSTHVEYRNVSIRLKMSEVDALRRRAKGDAKLRRILEKFTPHIEVVVDFD